MYLVILVLAIVKQYLYLINYIVVIYMYMYVLIAILSTQCKYKNCPEGDLLPEADGVANPVVACFPLRFDK